MKGRAPGQALRTTQMQFGNGRLFFLAYDAVASAILDSDTVLNFAIFSESQKLRK